MLLLKPIIFTCLKLATVALFAVTLLAAYGGRVDPDLFPYTAWLTLALPYFVALSLAAIVGWLIAKSIIMAGMGVAMFVFAWGPLTTAFPVNLPKEAVNPNRTFKVLSYNITHGWDEEKPDNGWNSTENRSFDFVQQSGADIVCLQELLSFTAGEIPAFSKERKAALRKVYPYWCGNGDAGDYKVLSKYPVRLVKTGPVYGIFEVKTPWGVLTVVDVHFISSRLSDSEREVMKELMSVKRTKQGMAQMKGSIRQKLNYSFRLRAEHAARLAEDIKEISGPLVVCGDFNDVPESWAYRTLTATGLSDAYADTGFGPMVTYNRYGFWFHIDQILYRPEYLKAISVKRGKLKSSDHYPLLAEFEWISAK